VHYPVLWRDLIKIFEGNLKKDKNLFADCTLGAGGHSRCLLETFSDSYVIATDIDSEVIPIAQEFLKEYSHRISLHHTSYVNIFDLPRFPEVFPANKKFDGIVLDLGMSSFQLENEERGFSFKVHGELDMRFNRKDPHGLTAFKVINFASQLEIAEIFKKYGEERDSDIAAEIICKYRNEQKISTAAHLSKVLNYAFFISKAINKYDSITRCFQALRIFVNRELQNVGQVMDKAFGQLEENGILAVISFHSLEDNIAFSKMKDAVRNI